MEVEVDREGDEMRTLFVLIKHALDPGTVFVDPLDGRFEADRLGYGPDPAGLAAAAWALTARDGLIATGQRARVVAVVAGPPDAAISARHLLALGADAAILVGLPAAAVDPIAAARALALGVSSDPTLAIVLAGAASIDRGSGAVPPALAEIMGLPFAGEAILDAPPIALGDRELRLVRRDAVGRRVACSVALPAVVAVRAADAPLPVVQLQARIASQVATIQVIDVAAVGHQATSSATCAPRRPPHLRPAPEGSLPEERVASLMAAGAPRRAGRVVTGPAATLVEAAMQFLAREGFLGGHEADASTDPGLAEATAPAHVDADEPVS